MGAEDFLVADSNAEAVAWIDRWPDWPLPALVVWGPPGSGKTHLGQVWRVRSGGALVPARTLAGANALNLLGGHPHLGVDGADSGTDELALLHLHNLLAGRGGTLLLTANAPPARWPLRLADLASRLRAAPAVRIHPPNDRLMAAVIAKQFADRQIAVGQPVLDLLVHRIERSFAAARDAVDHLDKAALAGGRRITVDLVRELVADGTLAGGRAEDGSGD